MISVSQPSFIVVTIWFRRKGNCSFFCNAKSCLKRLVRYERNKWKLSTLFSKMLRYHYVLSKRQNVPCFTKHWPTLRCQYITRTCTFYQSTCGFVFFFTFWYFWFFFVSSKDTSLLFLDPKIVVRLWIQGCIDWFYFFYLYFYLFFF